MHEFKAEEGFAAKKAGDNAAYPAMGRQSRTTLESGNTPMYHMFHDAGGASCASPARSTASSRTTFPSGRGSSG